MIRTINFFLLSAVLAFSTGCLKTTKLTPELTSQWGNVAVVSIAASELNFAYVGTTAFNNTYVAKELQDDGVDKKLASDVAAKISQKGVRAIPSPQLRPHVLQSAGDFYEKETLDFDFINASLGGNGGFTHLAILKGGRVAPQAYVGDPIGGSNQSLWGIGLYKRSFIGISDGAHFYTAASITIYDLATGKPFSWDTELKHVSTELVSFPKDESEVKEEKAVLFLDRNYDVILDAFEHSVSNLFRY